MSNVDLGEDITRIIELDSIQAVPEEGYVAIDSQLDGTKKILASAIGGSATIDFVGATSGSSGQHGLVPAPFAGYQNRFLRGDATWSEINIPTYSDFTGATSESSGQNGFVPAPARGYQNRFLKGDGTWAVTPYPDEMEGASDSSAGKGGLVPRPQQGYQNRFLRGDATWAEINIPEVADMVGATSIENAGDQNKYLKGDGTWSTVEAGSDFVGATSSTAGVHGLVPAPTTNDVNKFLKGDGTWTEAGTPGNWTISQTSLILQDSGKELNSLGWYCGNTVNYYEDTITWSITEPGSQTHTFTKVNAKPAFVACVHLLNGYWMDAIAVSTVADATYFSNNSQAHEFTYMDHTWYWSGGEQSLPFTTNMQISGVNTLPDDTIPSLEDAAKYLIDQGLVSFNSGKRTILSDPSQEYVFAAGGLLENGSDAPFRISSNGDIYSRNRLISSTFVGATPSISGTSGLVPAPSAGDDTKFLMGDGTWGSVSVEAFQFKNRESVLTGNKWIDGSPIKVFSFNFASSVSAGAQWSKLADFGLTDSVSRILFATGFVIEQTNGFTCPISTSTDYFTSLSTWNNEPRVDWQQGTSGTPYVQVYYI